MVSIVFMYTILDSNNDVLYVFASEKDLDKLTIAVEFAYKCDYVYVWANNSQTFVAQSPDGNLAIFRFEVDKIRLFSEE